MKHIYTYEHPTICNIKELDYILKDEGVGVRYEYNYKDNKLFIFMKCPTLHSTAYLPTTMTQALDNTTRLDEICVNYIIKELTQKDFFEEYLDRISGEFTKYSNEKLSIIINGYPFYSISNKGKDILYNKFI